MPSLNPACEKCPLHATTSGTVCVAGQGPKHAKVMVVGEAPGREEEKTGLPFQGASGKKLRSELAANGLTDVFITNTVRCRPPDNRKPSAAEIKACREYLDYEIDRVKPEIVVALGATPTKALFKGKAKVSQHHGTIIEDVSKKYRGYVSYHPAAMLYDPGIEPAFKADIARLARTLRGEIKNSDVPWNIVRRGNLHAFLREFREAKVISFDLETTGLFPHNPDEGGINCVGIGLPGKTWVIPNMGPGWYPHRKNPKKLHWHPGSPWSRGDAFKFLIRMLIAIAEKNKTVVCAQNGKFDNNWLARKVDKKFRLAFDTMLASHTIDENEDHDLKSLSRQYLDVPEYDLTTAEKKGKVDPFKLYQYNARDCGYTIRLRKVQLKALRAEPELERLFFSLVMPAARAMEDIELVGKTIDMEKFDNLALDLKVREIGLANDLKKLIGREINWKSSPQVRELLYGSAKKGNLGLECNVFTKKGLKSTSEAAIIDLKGKHPIIDKMIEYREVTKFRSTYVVGFRKFMVGDKLYISYKLHGTVTGRYSSRIHSIPRDGSVRNLVIAPPGWHFVQADISQAELRVIAQISHDLEMRKCFLEGIDIHWRTMMFAIAAGYISGEYADRVIETAKLLVLGDKKDPDMRLFEACEILLDYGHEAAIKVWPGWKEARKKAKAINFGYVYGMYEKKFILTAKTKYGWEPSWDEAHACREGYFQLYNELPKWHEKQKKLVKLNGFVRTMFGRRRRLPGIESAEKMKRMEAERQAINSPVQGTIGDWKAAVLVEIHETVNRDMLKLCGEHHDALLMLVKDGCDDQVLPQVIKIIRNPRLLKVFRIRMDIPMDGEVEIGPWGAGKPYKLPNERKAA